VSVKKQPAGEFPDTIYVVVVVGVAIGFSEKGFDKNCMGDQVGVTIP
jgi:hypothetical protein